LHHKEGYRLPVFIRATPIRDADGRIVGAIEIFNDNTANIAYRQRIEALEKEALLDSLTGLVNRRFIEMSLNSKLSEMVRYRSSFGVLFIDIDNFKSINDLYGHDVGDEVLKMVAKTALNTARVFDIIGRWGGEEFVGLIANVNEEQLHAIAQRHRVLIEQSNFSRLTHVIKVTVSIGAALVQPGDTMETLLKRADQAMYESKASGRNRVSMSFSTSCKTCSS
jgi:diguanylate cyclase (GGDEF)-like protein